MNARKLTLSLRGRWHGRYGAAPCPVCQPDGRKDQNALTLADGRAGLLLNCKKSGCDFRDILAAAGVQPGDYRKPDLREIVRRNAQDSAEAMRRSEAAKRVWAEAVPIAGTLAETYLRGRGISCALPDSLRFHPRCYHGPSQSALPAMIALVTGGEGFAIHRTFLRADGSGKAGLPDGDKMMLGRVCGGAVKLSDGPGRVVISEGIESGLSLLSGLLDGPMIVWARRYPLAGFARCACHKGQDNLQSPQMATRRAVRRQRCWQSRRTQKAGASQFSTPAMAEILTTF